MNSTVATPGWLGTLPNQWREVRPKEVFLPSSDRALPGDVHLTPSQTHGVLPQAEYMRVTGNSVVLNLSAPENMKHVKAGDFIIHLRSFQGGIERSSTYGKVSNAYTVLTPRPGALMHSDYFKHVLKSDGFIQALRSTTNQLRDGQSIRYEQFALVPLPCPPLDQQRQIADFLDDQVARIDEAIRLREEQAEALGQRLLGRVDGMLADFPRRRLMPLLAMLRDGTHASIPRVDDGIPLLSVRNMQRGGFAFREDDSRVSFADFREIDKGCPVRNGDILMAIVGATLGKTALVDMTEPFCLQRSVAVLRTRPEHLMNRYLLWALRSRALQDQLWLSAGFSAQPGVYLNTVAALQIPLPEVTEQERVAVSLEAESATADEARREMADQVELLRQRRRSLITAAVTGQFDVTTASGREVMAG